jgi:LPXTG-motif cell wall-anchored protein
MGDMMPLFLEAALLALAGFSVGLLLAFVIARRRRRKD